MSNFKTMATPTAVLREQEQTNDKIQRLAKMATAVVCIVGGAWLWQDLAESINSMGPAVNNAAKTTQVSSHRQSFGKPPSLSTVRVIEPVSIKKTMEPSTPKIQGFHKSSSSYQAKPILERTLLQDQDAQQELAKMISTTYKVPLKTTTLIVATSVVQAMKQQIDPFLILALIGQESSFKKDAESGIAPPGKGPQGLGQVDPRYHAESMKKTKVPNILLAPVTKQVELTALVLKGFFGQDKDVNLALQQYNQGANAIIDKKWKYSTKVLEKREQMTAVVAQYVKTNAIAYTDIKPNL